MASAIRKLSTRRSTSQLDVRVVKPLQNGDEFCDNRIVTSHYTAYNFVPKNLMEQFSKPANVYFLGLAILQCIPRITVTGGVPTILLPLIFIVVMNALKDGIEDYRRHRSDRDENDRATLCVSAAGGKAASASGSCRTSQMKWCDVTVGSLLVVKANEYIPADMVILASDHDEGHCFIETANLDGETNLKTKQAAASIFSHIGRPATVEEALASAARSAGTIECEKPNEFLYTFAGSIVLKKGSGQEEKVALDEQNIVLRGCKLKNVGWTVGVAVYTGRQTKIMMNSKDKKGRKISHLEMDVGKFTLLIALLQVILCLIAAICSAAFDTSSSNLSKRYLNLTDRNGNLTDSNGFVVFIIRFFNFMILFSNFIPLSLLVSMNVCKLVQVYFFYCDEDMIHQGIHCMPRTSDLNEEMGQIEYVFSDKTGTLTCNVMDFRKFCVQGITYGEGMTEIKRQVMLKMGKTVEEPPPPPEGGKVTPHVDLVDSRLDDLLRSKSGAQYLAVREILLHLAINHEVVAEVGENKSLTYSASSPDEAALCYGACHFGFAFKSRDSRGLVVELEDGTTITVQILAILKFTSARKRSSAIVRFTDVGPSGESYTRLMIYTKGADSVIMARLAPHLQGAPETLQTMDVLKEMAEDGLRTLCLAGRDLTQAELDSWMVQFQEAAVATDRRQDKLDAVADLIEKDLIMHGITGIEDRLQDDVSNTIVKMARAGIKVWMLTGDKTETAINIGIATGLLPAVLQGERPVLSASDFEVNGSFKAANFAQHLAELASKATEAGRAGRMYEGLVIDGQCLEVALEPENEKAFVAICRVCKTVVCCRVSPKQKGAVVRLMKREEKAITLAIGDGANDCNMIQSADVGVGIRGLEGLQAFNVSDYGITQFRFLQYLTLVHGRWCYRRIAILVNYMFYKNIVVVLPQYFLGCVSGFSGQKLYNDILYQSYNVVHSMLPIVLFAVLDQDVSKKASLEYPELYDAGPKRKYLNVRVSALWILLGLWHALVVFFVPYYTMSNGNMTHSDGKANDIWLVGTVVYLLVTIIVNLVVVLESYHLTSITAGGIAFSFFFWVIEHFYLSGFLTGSVVSSELYGSTQRLFSCPMLYLVVLTCVSAAIVVPLHFKGIHCSFFPSTLHTVQAKMLSEKRGRQ